MASAETHQHTPSRSFVNRFLPEKLYGTILFWFALAAIPFFLTVSAAYLRPVVFSSYIPYLAVGCGLIASYFKTKGLTFSYLLLGGFLFYFYPSIPEGEKVWQMTILLTLAVELFTILLVAEEIEALLQEASVLPAHTPIEVPTQLKKDFKEESSFPQEFLQEIERLKQEAELRRIEREQLLKKVEFVHSEIEILTRQKESWVAQARETRSRIKEEEGRVKELASHIHHLQTSILKLQSLPKEKEIEIQIIEDDQKVRELSGQIKELEAKMHLQSLPKEKEIQIQIVQDDQKIKELSDQIQYLQSLPKEKEIEIKIVEVEDERRVKELSEHIQTLQNERNLDSEESKARLLTLQEAVLTLQSQTSNSDSPKELAQAEGRYRQLRSQFDEKAATLNQTRKELFKAENELLTFEKRRSLEELEPNTEIDLALLDGEKRCDELEQEVHLLEEIISSFTIRV